MRPLYVIGTGGFAKEVGQLAGQINAFSRRWCRIEYLAQDSTGIGEELPYGTVTGTDAILDVQVEVDVVIGIGRPNIRHRITEYFLKRPWLSTPNLIHPSVQIDPTWVRLGTGNIVTRGTVLTCDIDIGGFNVFNLNCTIGHDVRIGTNVMINPRCNISGGVTLGDRCLVGTGVQILEGLTIVPDTTIGAGALVAKPIAFAGTCIGIPVKLKK